MCVTIHGMDDVYMSKIQTPNQQSYLEVRLEWVNRTRRTNLDTMLQQVPIFRTLPSGFALKLMGQVEMNSVPFSKLTMSQVKTKLYNEIEKNKKNRVSSVPVVEILYLNREVFVPINVDLASALTSQFHKRKRAA